MPQLQARRNRRLLTDFATIFSQMWYRDFPLQPQFRAKAQRADWTTHIGITVRSAADLMGLFTHFESGGRTDALLRDNCRNAVAAIEWEWSALHRGDDVVNEFKKLQELCAKDGFQCLNFVCLIGYARSGVAEDSTKNYDQRSSNVFDDYTKRWGATLPPLLLVAIHFEWKGRKLGRQFTRMTLHKIEGGRRRRLRKQWAYPWQVKGSRWEQEAKAAR